MHKLFSLMAPVNRVAWVRAQVSSRSLRAGAAAVFTRLCSPIASVAGAIRYITKDPVLDAFQGRIEATAATIDGGAGKQILTGIVNAPVVTDKFALRIAGTIENGGGWQDQPQAGIHNGNYQDLINVRTKALWKINDDFTAKLMIVVHRNNSKLGLGYENEDRTITVAVNPAQVLIPKKFDYELYNLQLNYDFQNLSLLSSTSYIDHRHQYPFSYIGGPATIYDGTLEGNDARHIAAHMLAQEFRVASRNSGAFKWTTGAFFRSLNHDENDTYQTLFAGSLYSGLVYIADDTYRSYSLFGDASYAFTDRIEAGAGVRYFHDRQTTFDGTTTQEGQFHSTDPRVYASYKITHDVNVYASIAKGFRSGGFNSSGLPSYKPESLLSYEIGTKGAVANGRIGFELAGYYSDYTDMLRRGLVYIPATTMLTSITSNIGTVHIKGVEGGITWRATQALTLNTTASWINSRIIQVNAADSTSIAGDTVDYVPKFSLTAGGNYAFNWAEHLPGFIRLDYNYRDKVDYTDRTSFPAANVPQTSDTLSLLDARLGISYARAQFELFGSNLTNQNKWIDPYYAWTNANRTRPRMIGIKAIVNFE